VSARGAGGPTWPAQWSGGWIWTTPPPDREQRNHVGYLRRRFRLDEVPSQVLARVTADSRFVLWVNGVEVSRGPARNIPERPAFHELDLAPHLHAGWNVVAAMVRHYASATPWWRPPAPFGQVGFGSFVFEAPGIALVSDGSWKAKPAPWRTEPFAGDPVREVVDGAGLVPGWTDCEFEDDDWTDAVVLSLPALGGLPSAPPTPSFSGMEPAGIAELTRLPRPTTLVSSGRPTARVGPDLVGGYDHASVFSGSGDAYTTYDVGGMTHGTVCLAVEAECGAIVDVYVGEDVSAAGLAVIEPRRWAARYIAGGRGVEEFETFDPIGFRYVTTVVRGQGAVRDVRAVERRYPTAGTAAFSCADERLGQIWRAGARTLELCAIDAFIDCPGREQNAWVGDSYLHTLVTLVSNSDWRLVRRSLRVGAHSRRPDGFLSAIAAGGGSTGAFNIPEYSAHWIRSLTRYVERSGDLELLLELLPTVIDVVAAFERHRDVDGLLRLPGIVFVDWAQTERGESTAAVDALYAAALQDFATLCEWGRDTERSDRARAAHAVTVRAFERFWDEERGVYLDALHAGGTPGRRVSQQTNALAIVAGLAPRDRWSRMLDAVLDESRVRVTLSNGDLPEHQHWLYQRWEPADFDPEVNVVAAQPFMRHFLHQAVAQAGQRDRIAALCLDWMPQIDRGNTTFEEFWDAPAGSTSRCHAWSATPTYDLTTHVLGVRPMVETAADLGFRRVLVEPAASSVTRLAGTVPTPHGELHVDLSDEEVRLQVPDGVKEVVLRLPGHEHVFGPGMHRLSIHA
jgi:hypothetical protein